MQSNTSKSSVIALNRSVELLSANSHHVYMETIIMSEEIPSSDTLPFVALKRNNWPNKIKTCVSRDSMESFFCALSLLCLIWPGK